MFLFLPYANEEVEFGVVYATAGSLQNFLIDWRQHIKYFPSFLLSFFVCDDVGYREVTNPVIILNLLKLALPIHPSMAKGEG